MESSPLIETKKQLLRITHTRLQEKILQLETAMSDLRASAEEETKSSAGDKYETGRAMIHLELEKLSQQLHEHSKTITLLKTVNVNNVFPTVHTGAVAETSFGHYFILVNGGEVSLDGKSFRVISPASPLGQLLMGRAEGDEVRLNNRPIKILRIY